MPRRSLAALLSALLLLALLTGCSGQHWRYEELSFTLPRDFQNCSGESYAADYDFFFDSGAVAIAGIRESRQVLKDYGVTDAEDYAQLLVRLNGLTCQPEEKDGIWCFTYEAVSGGVPITYICAVYEAENSFWQIQTYCARETFPVRQEAMWGWVLSIQVT